MLKQQSTKYGGAKESEITKWDGSTGVRRTLGVRQFPARSNTRSLRLKGSLLNYCFTLMVAVGGCECFHRIIGT